MDELKAIWEFLLEHWGTIGLVATWLGIIIVYTRNRADWRSKRFRELVNFSLNYVEDGRLKLRTLHETSVAGVWLNEYGVQRVLKAAERTTATQPFIILDTAGDMDFIKRAVVNVISAKFADTFVARSLGVPVKVATYCFAITFENLADMRTRKFRVLFIEKGHLQACFGPAAVQAGVTIDPKVHPDRQAVLRAMAELAGRADVNGVRVLGEVELGVAGT
jgi:hypothetical protein